jgi:hypothetical protein
MKDKKEQRLLKVVIFYTSPCRPYAEKAFVVVLRSNEETLSRSHLGHATNMNWNNRHRSGQIIFSKQAT